MYFESSPSELPPELEDYDADVHPYAADIADNVLGGFDVTAGLVNEEYWSGGEGEAPLDNEERLADTQLPQDSASPSQVQPVTPEGEISLADEHSLAETTYLEDGKYIPGWNFFFRVTHDNNATLANHIAPYIMQERLADEPYQVLEIGCSAGRDTWSMAAAFEIRDVNFRINATDINPSSIAMAQRPYYDFDANDFILGIEQWGLPPETADLFEQAGPSVQPVQSLRDRVSFNELDIRHQTPALGTHDVVVANNVFSHYAEPVREHVVDAMLGNIAASLRPGGLFTFSERQSRKQTLNNETLARHGLVPAPNVYGADYWEYMSFYQLKKV